MEGAWGMEETYQCDREGVENALQSQYLAFFTVTLRGPSWTVKNQNV